MAVFFPINSRRANHRKAKPTQQLIAFRLYSERFALPIRAVHKVIQMSKIYGAPQGGRVGITLYQEQELIVIDVAHRIFKGKSNQNLSLSSSLTETENMETENSIDELNSSFNINIPISESTKPEDEQDNTEQGYLLIVQNRTGNIVGLPIEERPGLLRVHDEAFKPLTSNYLNQGNIQCISALIVPSSEEPPLFLLNPDLLFQAHYTLPPASFEV